MTRDEATMDVDATSRLLKRLLKLADADAMHAYDNFAMTAIDYHDGKISIGLFEEARERLINQLCEFGP